MLISRTALVGGITLLVYGIIAIITTFKLQKENEQNELLEIRKNLNAHKEYVEALVERGFIQTRSFRSIVGEMRKSGTLSRELINQILKANIINNKDFLGLWMVWEPNAFDGLDAKYKNEVGSNEEGRFVPYWHWQGDSVIVENCVLFDESDYYQLPKKHQKEYLLEPYKYPVAGNDSLLVSIVSPILLDNVFKGVVGADISLSSLKKLVYRLAEIEKGHACLLSGEGTYVVHRDVTKIGNRNDRELGFFESQEEMVKLTVNPNFGLSEQDWTLLLEVPKETIGSKFSSVRVNFILLSGISAIIIFFLIFYGTIDQKKYTEANQEAQEQLFKSDARLTSLIEGPIASSIYSVDTEFKYTGFNSIHKNEMKEVFKADVEVGKYMPSLLPEPMHGRLLNHFKRAMSGERFNITSIFNDKYYTHSFSPVYDEETHVIGLTSSIQEVTARVTTEMELEKHRDHLEDLVTERTLELTNQKVFFQKIIDQVPALIFVRNISGEYILVNYLMAESLGFQITDVLGKNIKQTHGDLEEAETFKNEDLTIIETGKPLSNEFKAKWPDGSEKWLYLTKSRMYVDDMPLILGVHVDITHLKETQLRLSETNKDLLQTLNDLKSTQLMLIESEKMASLGLLTAGLAHEINNPINYVDGNAGVIRRNLNLLQEWLKEEIGEKDFPSSKFSEVFDEMFSLIGGVEEGSKRVINLIRDLSDFSRVDHKSKDGIIKVNECIELTVNLVKHQTLKNIAIGTDLGDFPVLQGNAQMLKQVLLNMLTNSCQAIENSGEIEVKSYEKEGNIHIQISDTGTGIDKENLTHVFEPFFTTKEVGEGTGLGLSISYNIIKELGGHIKIIETSRSGTQFDIAIPIS